MRTYQVKMCVGPFALGLIVVWKRKWLGGEEGCGVEHGIHGNAGGCAQLAGTD